MRQRKNQPKEEVKMETLKTESTQAEEKKFTERDVLEILARLGVSPAQAAVPASPVDAFVARFVPAIAPKRVQAPTPDWNAQLHQCSKCGKTGVVAEAFGTRRDDRGVERPQSWCRECRIKTSAKYQQARRKRNKAKAG
jgi:hypothetical protein